MAQRSAKTFKQDLIIFKTLKNAGFSPWAKIVTKTIYERRFNAMKSDLEIIRSKAERGQSQKESCWSSIFLGMLAWWTSLLLFILLLPHYLWVRSYRGRMVKQVDCLGFQEYTRKDFCIRPSRGFRQGYSYVEEQVADHFWRRKPKTPYFGLHSSVITS